MWGRFLIEGGKKRENERRAKKHLHNSQSFTSWSKKETSRRGGGDWTKGVPKLGRPLKKEGGGFQNVKKEKASGESYRSLH